MARRRWNPTLHPRDSKGRFTRSGTRLMKAPERSRVDTIIAGFQRRRGVSGRKAKGYLAGVAAGNDEQRAAVNGYFQGGFIDISRTLRAGESSPEIEQIDAAMQDLPDDLVVSRRVPASMFGDVPLDQLVGTKVRDAAYFPVAVGAVRANQSDVRMRIAVPKGTRAAVNPETGELLLDRDLELAVTHMEPNSQGGTDMYLVVLPKKVDVPDGDGGGDGEDDQAANEPLRGDDAFTAAPIRDRKSLEVATSTEVEAYPGAGYTIERDIDLNGVPGNEVRDAIGDYSDQGYQHVNWALRAAGGNANALPDKPDPASGLIAGHYSKTRVQKMVRGVDAAMTASQLTEPVLVYRGVTDPVKTFGPGWQADGSNVGLEWVDHSYTSTSTRQAVARKFAGDGAGVRLNVIVPAGVGAIGIENTSPGLRGERELLLDRGLRYRVVHDSEFDGVRTLDVEVVGRQGDGGGGEPPHAAEELPPVTPADRVLGGDFSELVRVGPQAGSNLGGLYEAPDGSRWYVKQQKSGQHAANEVLASTLYREAGVNVPTVVRGSGTHDLTGGDQTASRIVEGTQPPLLDDDKFMTQIREGFAIDAWLGNWDVAGAVLDNIVSDGDGKPWRIDLGGSLLFRAQGGPKGDRFGDTVQEWTSLRDPKTAPQASTIFTGLTRAEMVAAVKRVEQIKPAQIRELAAQAGMPEVADRLIARRKDLVGRLPTLRREARRQAAWDKAFKKARKDEQALDAVPYQTEVGVRLTPEPPDWPPERVTRSSDALTAYQGSKYMSINSHLRSDRKEDTSAAPHVENIDAVMDVSRLRQPVLVYRGITRPGLVFGEAWNSVDVVGLEWVDKAYASTSADLRVAEMFSSEGGVIMRILQPAGSPAVRLSNMAPPDDLPSGVGLEAELLLARGARRRIVADYGIDKSGRRIVDVEVIA